MTPHHLPQYDHRFKHIAIGGSFSVLIDRNDRAYTWGSLSTDAEVDPVLIEGLEDKKVLNASIGDSFAFLLGEELIFSSR